MRFTIWQCTDWCCEKKPHTKRWWNVAVRPGRYESFPSWTEALLGASQSGLWHRWSA